MIEFNSGMKSYLFSMFRPSQLSSITILSDVAYSKIFLSPLRIYEIDTYCLIILQMRSYKRLLFESSSYI